MNTAEPLLRFHPSWACVGRTHGSRLFVRVLQDRRYFMADRQRFSMTYVSGGLRGLIHLHQGHQRCWDTGQLSQSGHTPSTLLRRPARTPEDNSELTHNFVIIGPFWGAEDTKNPPLSLATTTLWKWLRMKYLPSLMGHREGQRAFVQITMYNVVLCVYNLYEQILTVILCVHTRIQKKKIPL